MDAIAVMPELIVGIILGGFAWAFRNWADAIRRSSQIILDKLEHVGMELHRHRLDQEKRVTRLETQIETLIARSSSNRDDAKND